MLSGFLVPADAGRPLGSRAVEDTAAAISDLLGGVLLDDPLSWDVSGGVFASVYRAEDRAGLPVNERLSVLATRLGIVDRAFHATARGDALLLGTTREGRDLDVPDAVAMAAHRCGYRIAPLTPPAPVIAEATVTGQAVFRSPVEPGTRSGHGPARR
jgi:hypothetical protein